MTNLNSFSVAGNLTGDPRIKTDENGEVRSVLFNVAVNRSKDKADFIPVRLTGAQYTAHMQQKLVKGAGVILNGRVENTQYKDQNGQNRSFFAVTPSYMIAGPRGSVNNGTVHGWLTHDPESVSYTHLSRSGDTDPRRECRDPERQCFGTLIRREGQAAR